MTSPSREIRLLQVHCPQPGQILGSVAGKFVQQLTHCLALNLRLVAAAIELLKSPRLAEIEDHSGARHPIGTFAMNEMSNYFKRVPGALTFVAQGPDFRQIA